MTPRRVRGALVVAGVLLLAWAWGRSGNDAFWSAVATPKALPDIANPVVRLRQAEQARLAGNLPEAILHARAAALLAPGMPAAHWDLAALLTASGRLDEAFVEYDVAIRLDPTPSAEHLSNLGLALAWSGRASDAVTRFRQALAVSPDVAWIHENLGYVLAATGDLQGARKELETAVRLDPSADRARAALAGLPGPKEPRAD